jgi:hypothetical protein
MQPENTPTVSPTRRVHSANLLGFQLVQLVNLLSHLSHSIIVLFTQVGQCALMLDVGFLKVPAQFSKLGLPLLVQFDLG